jgi:cobalt/nickel transport system ATP-binding protein
MPPILQLEGVSYRYPEGAQALADVSLTVERGDRVAVLGPSGSGKSTLLLHLNGLLLPQGGRVVVDGVLVTEGSMRAVRRLIGLVFQDPNDQLFLPTLLEDVAFGPLNDGCAPGEAASNARAVLSELGLAGQESRPAHHLSGGERRRAALATVLVMRPALVALDEPTGDLDARSRSRLIALLRARTETLLVATHDLTAAAELCRRAVVLGDGRVVADEPITALLGDAARLVRFGLSAP